MSHSQNFDKLAGLIRAQTFELMENGGTNPEATYDVIAEEEPALCAAFGRDRVLKLCEVIHYSEIPQISEGLQARFITFTRDYFGGRLPDYEFGRYTTQASGEGILLHRNQSLARSTLD